MRHPYDIDYLDDAQDILGDMFDFAINTCNINADKFVILFHNTNVADQFEKGNPKYIAGMNGCEVVRDVMYRAGIPIDDDIEDVMYLEKVRSIGLGGYYVIISGLQDIVLKRFSTKFLLRKLFRCTIHTMRLM